VSSELSKSDQNASATSAGLDLLRSMAGYPHRSVQMNKHAIRSRILIIQRDGNGHVVSSTERIEESEFTDLTGEWLD